MKKYLIITILLLAFFAGKAQIPGYMGKRIITGAEVSIGPGFPMIGWDASELKSDIFLGLSYGIHCDYVLSRNQSLGFKYNFASYKFNQAYMYDGFNDPNLWSVNPQYPPDPTYVLTPMKLNIHTVALSWKKFRTNIPAPLGRYFGLEVGASVLPINDVDGVLPRESGGPKKGKYVSMVQPFFGIGWGTQRIYFNGLVQNVNINLGLYPGLWFMGDSGYFGDTSTQDYPTLVKYKARAIASNAVFLRLTLGLGWIY